MDSTRDMRWMFGSNLSPMENYVLTLHDQLYDIQQQLDELQNHKRSFSFEKINHNIPSRYSYVRFHFHKFPGIKKAELAFLAHLFREGDRIWKPCFAVWKIVPMLEDAEGFQIRCCVQWAHYTTIADLEDFLKTMDTRIFLKTVSVMDSLEMFVDYIVGWVPDICDGGLCSGGGCRAWLKPSYDGEWPFPTLSSVDIQQESLRSNWNAEALFVWLRPRVED
jgi:hypothetical protein